MAKTREVACQYYAHEGECLKGREGTFYGSCQTCKKYAPQKGAAPARRNNKRRMLEKAREYDQYNY